MKYIIATNSALAASEINKELENGAKVILMIPLLKTDNWGSYTAGYNVLKTLGRYDLIEVEKDLAPNLMNLIETEWSKIWKKK